ncbi:syntaxin-12-like [Watersipora subatra]|uniref:syntaxin-12-like n=1 Tax=Watersipora subatra TaxID=2589382 RepID=UPI00355BC8D2
MDSSRQRINSPLSSYGAIAGEVRGSFEELSREISNLIFKINSNATVIERQSKRIATKDDNSQLRQKLHEVQQETNTIAADITRSLQTLNDICGQRDKQKRLQVDRLKNSFRSALEKYHEIQKKLTDKIKMETLKNQRAQSFDQEPDAWSDEAALFEQNERRQQLMQQQAEAEDDLAFMREREERVRQLESDVLDVNEIFKQLGTMVQEQGDLVDHIETNVISAADYVEEGNVELGNAVTYQKSSRKKLCILVIICLIIAAVIAIILGVTLSKH